MEVSTNYFDHPFVGSTTLKCLAKHYESPRAGFRELRSFNGATSHMVFGSALHDFLLMGEDYFFKKWFIYDENSRPEPTMTFGAKRNKEWRDNIMKKVNPERLITLEQFEKIKVYIVEIMSHPAFGLFTVQGSEFEKEFYCPKTKRKVKGDIVNLEKSFIVDVKKCISSDSRGFGNTLRVLEYGLQGGHYTDTLEGIYGKPFRFFFFTASDEGVNCFEISKEKLILGKDRSLEMLEVYNKYKDTPTMEIPGYEFRSGNKYGINIL